MPLWGGDIYENQMYEPILRLFQRSYMRGEGVIECHVKRPYAKTNDRLDVVYFRAYHQIHVVEAKRYISDTDKAIKRLNEYRGNYKYIALPDAEYFCGRSDVDEYFDNGFGLMLVGKKGTGYYADWCYLSRYFTGDFSGYYY